MATPTPTSNALLPRKLGPELHLSAARRLVAQTGQNTSEAALKLLDAAAGGKIDLSLLFGTVGPLPGGSQGVRQVAMAVPAVGRTAGVFVSEPLPGGDPGGAEQGQAERIACIQAIREHLSQAHLRQGPSSVQMLQALPTPADTAILQALKAVGFIQVGDLLYLQRSIRKNAGGLLRPPPVPSWPKDIRVASLAALGGPVQTHRQALGQALERSYEDTLDCPALCGLRATTDVLDSHLAVGEFDPALWFLVLRNDQPLGCMLLSRLPDQRAVELVYFGLAPQLRGIGLGRSLLDLGLRAMPPSGYDWLLCAVDRQNAPAVRVYQRAGFRSFAERVAMVLSLDAPKP